MTTQTFVIAMEALVCAAFLVWFFVRPWQDLWVAVSRQHIFELRDRLFDIAADGRIEFSDPLYMRVREYLNGCIRFAHKITFGSFLAGVISLDTATPRRHSLWNDIDRLAEGALKGELQDIMRKSLLVLLGHMVIRSPLLWLLLSLYPFAAAMVFVNNKAWGVVNYSYASFRELVLEMEQREVS